MRTLVLMLVPAAILTSVSAAGAEDVQVKDLPASVRSTLQREAAKAVIEDIEREWWNGSGVVYSIELERDDQELILLIDADGDVIGTLPEADARREAVR